MHNVPNLLTGLRLVLSLAMFAALAAIGYGFGGHSVSPQTAVWLARFAVAAFVVAAVTDFFDGWLARRWGVVSVLGAIMDPIADKILVCAAILGLLGANAPGVLVCGGVILFREFAVSAMREVLAPRGIKLPVTRLAKSKTALQLVGLGAVMLVWFWPAWKLNARIDHLRTALQLAEAVLAIAAVVTLWTGFDYVRQAWAALRAQYEARTAQPPHHESAAVHEALVEAGLDEDAAEDEPVLTPPAEE